MPQDHASMARACQKGGDVRRGRCSGQPGGILANIELSRHDDASMDKVLRRLLRDDAIARHLVANGTEPKGEEGI